MNEYKIIYQCENGYKGEEVVSAANRTMAFEVFMSLGYENVVDVECYPITES